MSNINVFAPELRNVVRKDLKTIPGAWVDLFDDITVEQVTKAQDLGENPDIVSTLSVLILQIFDWNFSDDKGKLDITIENLKRLPLKIITELSQLQAEVVQDSAKLDKKKELSEN